MVSLVSKVDNILVYACFAIVQKCSHAARLLRVRFAFFLTFPIHLLMIELWEKLE